jgi:cytochrome b pre-mRNA-processing protein 3
LGINLGFLQRLFGDTRQREALVPLYRAAVARGRDPAWYREGRVPDTLDGRFDMIAAIVALVLVRIEAEGEAGRAPALLLTETFIDDMDGTLRQIGIGDHVVGKQVGKMMGALGGRLAAFRAGRDAGIGFAAAVTRNIFHEAPPSPEAAAFVADRLESFDRALGAQPIETLLAGELPTP